MSLFSASFERIQFFQREFLASVGGSAGLGRYPTYFLPSWIEWGWEERSRERKYKERRREVIMVEKRQVGRDKKRKQSEKDKKDESTQRLKKMWVERVSWDKTEKQLRDTIWSTGRPVRDGAHLIFMRYNRRSNDCIFTKPARTGKIHARNVKIIVRKWRENVHFAIKIMQLITRRVWTMIKYAKFKPTVINVHNPRFFWNKTLSLITGNGAQNRKMLKTSSILIFLNVLEIEDIKNKNIEVTNRTTKSLLGWNFRRCH